MSITQRVGRAVGRYRQRRDNPTGAMTLMEHLGELRTRIIIAFSAIAIGAIIGWFLYTPVFHLLRGPYCDVIQSHPKLNPFPTQECAFAFLTPVGPFFLKIKVVSFIAIGIALAWAIERVSRRPQA